MNIETYKSKSLHTIVKDSSQPGFDPLYNSPQKQNAVIGKMKKKESGPVSFKNTFRKILLCDYTKQQPTIDE